MGRFGHHTEFVGTVFIGQKEARKLVGMVGRQFTHHRFDGGENAVVDGRFVPHLCRAQLCGPQGMAKATST